MLQQRTGAFSGDIRVISHRPGHSWNARPSFRNRWGGKHFIEDEQAADDYLKSLTNKLETEENLKVSYDKVVGVAGPSIVEYCGQNNIDLIAIATHGRSGPGRVVLGSVADYVIRNSGIPILLIRPTEKI